MWWGCGRVAALVGRPPFCVVQFRHFYHARCVIHLLSNLRAAPRGAISGHVPRGSPRGGHRSLVGSMPNLLLPIPSLRATVQVMSVRAQTPSVHAHPRGMAGLRSMGVSQGVIALNHGTPLQWSAARRLRTNVSSRYCSRLTGDNLGPRRDSGGRVITTVLALAKRGYCCGSR